VLINALRIQFPESFIIIYSFYFKYAHRKYVISNLKVEDDQVDIVIE